LIWPFLLVCAGLSGCTNHPTGPITSLSSSLRDPISERISGPVIHLGYTQQVAKQLVDWVGTWKDGQGLVLLDRWADELAKARADQAEGQRSAKDLSQIWGNRAVVFYRLGTLDRAIADCNQALALDAGRPGPFNTRASVYVRQGRFEQALEDLQRALELDDRSAMVFTNRGNVYSKMGQFDRAIQDYDRAIELEPSWAKTHLMLGNAYHRLGRYREAIASYTRAIRIDPSLERAYANRGMSYAKLGQRLDARQDLLTAAKVDPSMAGYVAQASDQLDLGPLGSLPQSDSREAH